MNSARPELIFVSGSQKGERAILMTDIAIMGRQQGCDILIQEEYASRKHIRFDVTPEGVIMENLSTNGTRVNSKIFKTGKKILLETGDVLGVGVNTTILFIESGDDPETALTIYKETHPEKEHADNLKNKEETKKTETTPPFENDNVIDRDGKSSEILAKKNVSSFSDKIKKTPENPLASPINEEESEKRTKKKRLYIIFGIIYLIAIITLFFFLKSCETDKNSTPEKQPFIFEKRKDIRNILTAPLKRPTSTVAAASSLAKARSYFDRRMIMPENLYYCVFYFREYVAYQPKTRKGFENIRDEEKANQAIEELTNDIYQRYTNAIIDEKRGKWSSAQNGFEEILVRIPQRDSGKDSEVVDKFIKNIIAHSVFSSRKKNSE